MSHGIGAGLSTGATAAICSVFGVLFLIGVSTVVVVIVLLARRGFKGGKGSSSLLLLLLLLLFITCNTVESR